MFFGILFLILVLTNKIGTNDDNAEGWMAIAAGEMFFEICAIWGILN